MARPRSRRPAASPGPRGRRAGGYKARSGPLPCRALPTPAPLVEKLGHGGMEFLGGTLRNRLYNVHEKRAVTQALLMGKLVNL